MPPRITSSRGESFSLDGCWIADDGAVHRDRKHCAARPPDDHGAIPSDIMVSEFPSARLVELRAQVDVHCHFELLVFGPSRSFYPFPCLQPCPLLHLPNRAARTGRGHMLNDVKRFIDECTAPSPG